MFIRLATDFSLQNPNKISSVGWPGMNLDIDLENLYSPNRATQKDNLKIGNHISLFRGKSPF